MELNDKNKEVCAKLWSDCEPQLRRICNSKLSNYPSEIDDVISDTYLALCNALEKGVNIKHPKAWLFGVLNNQIKLKYSELKKRKDRFVSYDTLESNLFYNDTEFEETKLTDEAIDILVEEIFDELSDAEKTLYILIYEKKLKLKKIANILNLTEAAVKQKHYRLKRKINQIAKDKTR